MKNTRSGSVRPLSVLVALLALASFSACDDPPPDGDAGVDGGGPDAGPDPGDPSEVIVRYQPSTAAFWDMPWPSDARLTADGTPDLALFKGRRPGYMDAMMRELEASVHGFATMPVAYFALTRPVTDASIPQGTAAMAADSTIQLMDLSADGCGQRFPLEVSFAAEADQHRDDNMLQIANAIGTVLEPGRAYGVLILRSFGEEESRSTPRPAVFDEALADTTSSDPLARSLDPLRTCLPSTDVALDDVAVATVFTTQDPVAEMQVIRDYVMDASAVETRAVADWRQSEAWSRRRLDLVTYSGTVQMPMFQDGETPYAAEGGSLIFDASGQPEIQRWEEVEVAVAYQTFEVEPEGPRPVLVFIDGTGWSPWNHLRDNWIDRMLGEGYVIFSFMPQFHGGRAGFEGDTEVSTFNIPNPPAGRSNFRQQSAETSYFVRLIREQLAGLSGLPTELATDRIVYGGHSQGALVGALTAAVEDEYVGYVFNGLSSFLTLTILFREDIIDFNTVVSALYNFRGDFDRWHPLLHMLQLGAEVVDPHNYASRWHGWAENPNGSHVFVINGYEDATTTPRGMEHLTMTANMPPIDPPGWEVDPDGVWDGAAVSLPVQGNITSFSDGAVTNATYLDFDTGHGTVYSRIFARELASTFWETARSGTPALYSLNEYQCGDGADDDEDGLVDCDDPDCDGDPPCGEGSCDNGVDEDSNGLVDCDDPECMGVGPCREMNCGDAMDNDGDGDFDCDDSDCASRAPCAEGSCDDGVDGDSDGDTDCADSDCATNGACRETRCTDGRDNDDDGMTDCDDSDCVTSAGCPETACTGGVDDNMDGRVDCDDPGCQRDAGCTAPATETACSTDGDADSDGLFGCDDPDCALDGACATTCADGNLASAMGVRLWAGSLMTESNDYPPGDCTSLGTGGEAPDIAFTWTAPAEGSYVFSTYGSRIDTVLTVNPSDCSVVELSCDDDHGPVATSYLTRTLAMDEEVVVVIHAYDAERVDGEVTLHIYPTP